MGKFLKYDTVSYDVNTEESILLPEGTLVNDISKLDDGFTFVAEGNTYYTEEDLYDSEQLSDHGFIDLSNYVPCPNMTPLNRKFLLL
jgi:hypothetical protein